MNYDQLNYEVEFMLQIILCCSKSLKIYHIIYDLLSISASLIFESIFINLLKTV